MSKISQKNIVILLFFILGIFFIGLSVQKIQKNDVQLDNPENKLEIVDVSEIKDEEKEIEYDYELVATEEVETENSPSYDYGIPEGDLTFKLIISEEVFDTSFNEGQTLLEIMNQMKDMDKISFEEKDFSGLGSYIYSINGVEENKKDGLYWIYYINDKQANIGVSNYVLKQDDQIKWQLESNIY